MSLFHCGIRAALALVLALATLGAEGACRDAVVLVHGNTGTPAQFNATYIELRARGWADADILRPAWGSRSCAACNDHSGSEEAPVLDALVEAIARSCTGRIDVLAHSMGVTLAAKQIVDYRLAGDVHTFVGIAGATRGLWSCGTYPLNVATSTCGAQGLSVNSPLLNRLQGRPLGLRMVSIKSWIDQVVCATGLCTVGGVHSSQSAGENASYTLATGHFGLLGETARLQVDLIE